MSNLDPRVEKLFVSLAGPKAQEAAELAEIFAAQGYDAGASRGLALEKLKRTNRSKAETQDIEAALKKAKDVQNAKERS